MHTCPAILNQFSFDEDGNNWFEYGANEPYSTKVAELEILGLAEEDSIPTAAQILQVVKARDSEAAAIVKLDQDKYYLYDDVGTLIYAVILG